MAPIILGIANIISLFISSSLDNTINLKYYKHFVYYNFYGSYNINPIFKVV